MRPFVCAAALALAGCNQILGIGDVHTGSGSNTPDASNGDSSMAGNCPTAPANTVIACSTITHVRADGTTFTTQEDLSQLTVAAYISDSSQAGFTVVNGQANGMNLEIDGVPDGSKFYLRIQNPQAPFSTGPRYFYTDQHTIDLGYTEMGRDSTPATLDTEITLNMTNMKPWVAPTMYDTYGGDSITLASFNAGTSLSLAGAGYKAGMTSFDQANDWRNAAGEESFGDFSDEAARSGQLIDQTNGDDLWAFHVNDAVKSDAAMRPYEVFTITDSLSLSNVKMTDGTAQTVGGAFQTPTAATNPITLSISPSNFRPILQDGGRYGSEGYTCSVAANQGAKNGLSMVSLLLFQVSNQIANDPGAAAGSLSLPYANPLPSTWPEVLGCTYWHFRFYVLPGTTNAVLGPSYVTSDSMLTSNTVNWTPEIDALQNIKIDNLDAMPGGAVPYDGTTPVTMSWDAVAGVTHYEIRAKDQTSGQFVGVFDTSDTTIALPASAFTMDHFYVFRVFAIQTSGDYEGGHFFDFKAPFWSVRLVTGMFRFSKNCGNGTVDAGEDCDPGSPNTSTANCDADCSAVMCGDGFVNAAAGEACDNVVDSATCDALCKVPKCGDGEWDGNAGEQCDDGNLTNGDGCSSTCTLEKCGNGTVDPPFEQCDDGNRINGDGCDAFCQFE